MKVTREVSYQSNKFTLADLRQIVEETESFDGDTDVALRIYKADPPYAQDSYYIEIG